MGRWLQKRHYFPFPLDWSEIHQAKLASSRVREADGQPHVRTEGVELRVGRPPHESCQTRWWDQRGWKVFFLANTLYQVQGHLWNSIIKDSLPLSPGRRQQTSHWIVNKQVRICSSDYSLWNLGWWQQKLPGAQADYSISNGPKPFLRGCKLHCARRGSRQPSLLSLVHPGVLKTPWPISNYWHTFCTHSAALRMNPSTSWLAALGFQPRILLGIMSN